MGLQVASEMKQQGDEAANLDALLGVLFTASHHCHSNLHPY